MLLAFFWIGHFKLSNDPTGIELGTSHHAVRWLNQLHIRPIIYPFGRILSEIYTFLQTENSKRIKCISLFNHRILFVSPGLAISSFVFQPLNRPMFILQHTIRIKVNVKVNWTLVQTQRLCTGRTAYRGSRGIALLFLDHETRRGWWVSVTPRPLFIPGKDPVPIVQEAGWAPRAGLDRCRKSRPHRDSIPGLSSRSQPLYRLRYRAHIRIKRTPNSCALLYLQTFHKWSKTTVFFPSRGNFGRIILRPRDRVTRCCNIHCAIRMCWFKVNQNRRHCR